MEDDETRAFCHRRTATQVHGDVLPGEGQTHSPGMAHPIVDVRAQLPAERRTGPGPRQRLQQPPARGTPASDTPGLDLLVWAPRTCSASHSVSSNGRLPEWIVEVPRSGMSVKRPRGCAAEMGRNHGAAARTLFIEPAQGAPTR